MKKFSPETEERISRGLVYTARKLDKVGRSVERGSKSFNHDSKELGKHMVKETGKFGADMVKEAFGFFLPPPPKARRK